MYNSIGKSGTWSGGWSYEEIATVKDGLGLISMLDRIATSSVWASSLNLSLLLMHSVIIHIYLNQYLYTTVLEFVIHDHNHRRISI